MIEQTEIMFDALKINTEVLVYHYSVAHAHEDSMSTST